MTASEIRACSRANLPQRTMAQTMRFIPTSRAGKTRKIEAILFLKRFADEQTRATLQVRAPLDVSGVSYLWIDTSGADRLFLYLPSLQRVRRITGKTAANSMLGSDFSYADIKYLRGVTTGGQIKRLDDSTVEDRSTYTLQLIPGTDEESVYQRVVFHIDQKTCVPLQIDFYDQADTPHKRMNAAPDSLEKLGEHWVARRLVMRDLNKKTHTALNITALEFDQHINDAVLNQRGFYLGAYLQNPK